MCVCVREREREREHLANGLADVKERACVWCGRERVCVSVSVSEIERVCVCARERAREREHLANRLADVAFVLLFRRELVRRLRKRFGG